MAIKPRRSQYEKGISELRSMILNGNFAPQERLSETMLAELLDISRTPLRQAIDRLLEEGLLERRASGGTMVARITMQDIVDAIELRGVLEGTAARFAAEATGPYRARPAYRPWRLVSRRTGPRAAPMTAPQMMLPRGRTFPWLGDLPSGSYP